MTTGSATGISQSGATLTGSYSGASAQPYELWFEYGTSQTSMTQTAYWNDVIPGTAGSYSASISGLDPGTKYYYRAVIQVGNRDFYGEIRSFTTNSTGGSTSGDHDAYAASWLGHYEVPATDVQLSSGQRYHDRVSETHGSTYAYIYNPSNSNQRIVTHTFSYNSAEQCNYTILYDKNYKCALWAAIEYETTNHPDKNVGRNTSWKYDPAIPQSWQPDLSGTYGGSYDRGHQIASNARQTTVDENKQTFYYSNISPEDSSVNSGVINTMEQRIAYLAGNLTSNKKMFVVTGPIFGSTYSTTTDASGHSCPVPSQYYTCIMTCTFDTSGNITAATGCAYLIGNVSGSTRQEKTIDQIESLTGFDFFANVPDSIENSAEATATSIF